MKAWAVTDAVYEVQVAVIAETRSRAKTLAFGTGEVGDDWIDLRCRQVKSPNPLPATEQVLSVKDSMQYGFELNWETMDYTFPAWSGWIREYERANR